MTISFDSDRHDAFVEALRTATNRIQDHLDDLDSAVAAGRAEWSGRARDAYDLAQREWTESMTRLRRALEHATEGATRAGQAFRAAETAAARLWA